MADESLGAMVSHFLLAVSFVSKTEYSAAPQRSVVASLSAPGGYPDRCNGIDNV